MKRIGVISDTHGTFDEPLRKFLGNVDEIWHAGDIGSLTVGGFCSGAGDGARTRYLHLGKVALYQMSYARRTCVL